MIKQLAILLIMIFTVHYAVSQSNGTYTLRKGRKIKTTLILTEDKQFLYTTYTRGHLTFQYHEKGNYQQHQDTLILVVKEYGVEVDKLEPEMNYLERKVLIKRNKALIIGGKGELIERLTKRKTNKAT